MTETLAKLTIQLDGMTLLTPNVRRRMHRMAQARITKEQRQLARTAGNQRPFSASLSGQANGPRDIFLTLVRGKGQRLVDLDAVPSALKPFLDGFVDAGLLVDDSPRFCTPWYFQERGPKALLKVSVSG